MARLHGKIYMSVRAKFHWPLKIHQNPHDFRTRADCPQFRLRSRVINRGSFELVGRCLKIDGRVLAKVPTHRDAFPTHRADASRRIAPKNASERNGLRTRWKMVVRGVSDASDAFFCTLTGSGPDAKRHALKGPVVLWRRGHFSRAFCSFCAPRKGTKKCVGCADASETGQNWQQN
jgi:hypothetical protein